MEYSKEKHRWILTLEEANERVNFSSIIPDFNEQIRVLDSISRSCYNFVYSRGNRRNKAISEYLIAKSDKVKEIFLEAMQSQLEATIMSGQDSVKNMIGINFDNGNVIDWKTMASRTLSIEAQEILVNGADDINLCYAGIIFPYYYGVVMDDGRYERYDY